MTICWPLQCRDVENVVGSAQLCLSHWMGGVAMGEGGVNTHNFLLPPPVSIQVDKTAKAVDFLDIQFTGCAL